jgi:hypothetical protein
VRAIVLALASSAAFAAPPVTSAEALQFHEKTLCGPSGKPGTGLRRADGHGWVISPLPGKHEFYAEGGEVSPAVIDMTPSEAYKIRVLPKGAKVQWCPVEARLAGRDRCGPVPDELLWDAHRVGDPVSVPTTK